MFNESLDSHTIHTVLTNPFIRITLIIIIALIARQIIGRIIITLIRHGLRRHPKETKTDRKKRVDTLVLVVGTGAGVVIWTIAVVEMLGVLNFNLGSVIAGAGFLGLALGLSAQTTIRDYLSGIFIILDNQYRVGDIITLSGGTTGEGATGVVEEISLRITKLRDLDGTLTIIRNGDPSVIINRTFDYSSVVLDIGVDYGTDIDKVVDIMNKVGNAMATDIALGREINQPIQFLRIDHFTESGVILRVVGQVKPASQWKIAGDYRRRLLKAFLQAGIKIVS